MDPQGAVEAVATPTSPEEAKVEDAASPPAPISEVEPITNGEAVPADIIEPEPKVEEAPKQNETIEPKPVEQLEAKIPEEPAVLEEPKVAEEPKPVAVTETIEPKVEEVKVEEHAVAEPKEVRNEEVPPPLPSSNPPSPVTVFAESTMADVPSTDPVPVVESISPVVESTVEPVSHPDDTPETVPEPSPTVDAENTFSKGDCPMPLVNCVPEPELQIPEPEPQIPESEAQTAESQSQISEPQPQIPEPQPQTPEPQPQIPESQPQIAEPQAHIPEPVVQSQPDLPTELVAESEPVPIAAVEPSSPVKEPEPVLLEQVINADSLPDISTESLPSLPEPLSESLPEPMSLPPVDCIPEPIASESESVADIPLPNSEVILTNGDAHGPPSPVADDTALTTSHEGPIKQVIASSEQPEITDEKRHEPESAVPAAAVEE